MDSDHQADKAWLLGVQRKLYQWSRQHPDERYRELWNWITDPRNLRCAWARVATNQGKRTAGIDGKTVGSIRRDIGEHAYLEELRSALRAGTYVPSPCRNPPPWCGLYRPLSARRRFPASACRHRPTWSGWATKSR